MVHVMNEAPLPTPLTTPAAERVRKPSRKETKNLMRRDGVWYFHKFVDGKREFGGRKTPFSLETRDLALAKARRDAILRAASGAEIDRVLGKTARNVASLQEVVDAYLLADYPREDTRKKNVQRLKLLLKKAGVKRRLADMTPEDLTLGVVIDFQAAVVAAARAAGHDDESDAMLSAKFGANRTLAQARSIFANERPFRKLQVPRPAGFLEADEFNVKELDHAFVPLSPAELELFATESTTAPAEVRAVWLCMRWLGLRNDEVGHVKLAEWLVETPRGWVLRVKNYPYYRVKGVGSVRDLPVVEWLRRELQDLAGAREWLVPGETPTERYNVTHRTINDWMGEVYARARADGRLPAATPTRTAYDWRKQAGSELYAKTKDILQVSKWLGHQSVHTTTKWYVNLIGGLPSLA